MAHAFYLGVDVAGEVPEGRHEVTVTILQKEQEASDEEATYRLDHIRQHTDVTSAEEFAGHIQSLVAEKPYIGRTNIILNRAPSFGDALAEALRDRGLDPVAVTLTAGEGAVAGERDEIGVHLGTADAVRTLADLYRDQRLGIDDYATEAASELARAVQRASEVLDEADGNQATPDAGEPLIDELNHVGATVTSAALAAWIAAERSFDPTERLKESPQTGRPDEGPVGT